MTHQKNTRGVVSNSSVVDFILPHQSSLSSPNDVDDIIKKAIQDAINNNNHSIINILLDYLPNNDIIKTNKDTDNIGTTIRTLYNPEIITTTINEWTNENISVIFKKSSIWVRIYHPCNPVEIENLFSKLNGVKPTPGDPLTI